MEASTRAWVKNAMGRKAKPTDDGLKPLAVRHERGREILGIGDSAYWKLFREGKLKKVGSGRSSRADYASIEAHHRSQLEEPEKPLAVNVMRVAKKAEHRDIAVK